MEVEIKKIDCKELGLAIKQRDPELYNIFEKEFPSGVFDWEFFRDKIRHMRRYQPLYKVLKEELSRLGYWQLKARGNPRKGYRKGIGKVRGNNA